MHVESAINRLDSKRLAANKEEYFYSIDKVIKSFPKRTQRRIKSANYYEVVLIALREKKYFFAMKYIIKGLASPTSLIDLYKRYKGRK